MTSVRFWALGPMESSKSGGCSPKTSERFAAPTQRGRDWFSGTNWIGAPNARWESAGTGSGPPTVRDSGARAPGSSIGTVPGHCSGRAARPVGQIGPRGDSKAFGSGPSDYPKRRSALNARTQSRLISLKIDASPPRGRRRKSGAG